MQNRIYLSNGTILVLTKKKFTFIKNAQMDGVANGLSEEFLKVVLRTGISLTQAKPKAEKMQLLFPDVHTGSKKKRC